MRPAGDAGWRGPSTRADSRLGGAFGPGGGVPRRRGGRASPRAHGRSRARGHARHAPRRPGERRREQPPASRQHRRPLCWIAACRWQFPRDGPSPGGREARGLAWALRHCWRERSETEDEPVPALALSGKKTLRLASSGSPFGEVCSHRTAESASCFLRVYSGRSFPGVERICGQLHPPSAGDCPQAAGRRATFPAAVWRGGCRDAGKLPQRGV